MIVMPSNSTGWFWHCLARETGRIGHLYSPNAQRGPWEWMPYALDNGTFALWSQNNNSFDESRWMENGVWDWRRLLFWSCAASQKPLWAIVPDRPGSWEATLQKWNIYSKEVVDSGIPLALAVQDGATPSEVEKLNPSPSIIAIGGSTEWKWKTAEMWLKTFPRVHLLRCNSPERLQWLENHGCESCDGTGWNRGNRKQTKGLEEWARMNPKPVTADLWPSTCRAAKKTERNQLSFA